jgi:dihydrofolate reductase
MGIVRVSSSVSLDGFSAGPDVSHSAPMGVGGERLHHWLFDSDGAGSDGAGSDGAGAGAASRQADAAIAAGLRASTGAVVVGRRTYEIGVDLWGDVPYPVPTFVLTHRAADPRPMTSASFTFVTDGVAAAIEAARLAAGDRDVLVMGGAEVIQHAIAAGLVDELLLNLVPVLLHRGTRLLEATGDQTVELERTEIVATDAVTHLRYRVLR